MGKYLGFIDVKQTGTSVFYNFKPTYELSGSTLIYLSGTERQELLPDSEYGNINFYSSKPEYELAEYFHDTSYVFFEFVLSDLEANFSYAGERNRTGYKVDVSKIPSNKIQEMSQLDFFQVIPKEGIIGDYRVNQIVDVNDIGLYDGQIVYLQIDESVLLGPYTVGFRLHGNQFFVNTKLKESKYVITGLNINNYEIEKSIQKIGMFGNERHIWNRTANTSVIYIDVILDELLLQNFKESLTDDSIKEGKIKLSDIGSLLQAYQKSYLVGSNIPKNIQDERLERLRTFFTDEDNLGDTFDFLADVIPALLLRYKDAKQFATLVTNLSDNKEFMSKVQSFREILGRVESLKVELDELNQQKLTILEEIEAKGSRETAAEILADYQSEIEEKIRIKDGLQLEIEQNKQQLGVLTDGTNLQERLKLLTENVDYKEKRERELDTNISKIEARLDSKFKNSTENVVNFAFDGMLANKLIRQAAKWETQQNKSNNTYLIEQLKTIILSEKREEALVDYIYNNIKYYRPNYSKNDILNIFICISQGFLTVFSGEPGTGKTSICNILAHSLGLTKPMSIIENHEEVCDINRYIAISVERGWTSKRDFIGYYNPLTKNFDKSNRRVFDSFQILDKEARGSSTDLPFIFLLDEANLSPMEYYWADFMNICDDWNENSSINLGENYQLNIPESLRFVATINNDHTTETLSPRLLDRAWVIVLPSASIGAAKEVKYNSEGIELIAWSALEQTFGCKMENITPMNGEAKEIYEKIYTLFRTERITISPRTDNAIRKYWSVAQYFFVNESDGTDASIVALDYAFAQKVLPQISGNGDKYREFLDSIYIICKDSNLHQSSTLLKNIIEKGDSRMKFYQFFA